MINLGTSTMQDFALGDNLVERIDLGDTTIFDPYTTLTATLPLSFNSRVAGALKNYRLYGDSDGSGVQTENLVESIEQGTWSTTGFVKTDADTRCRIGNIIDVITGQSYTIHCETTGSAQGLVNIQYKNDSGTSIGESGWQNFGTSGNYTVTIPSGATKITIILTLSPGNVNCSPLDFSNIMFVPGSTAPTTYIPFGYKIPISISDGTNTSNYDLFIGSTKLGAEEYLDYGEQKVYKRTKNLFDKNAKDTNNGYVRWHVIISTGAVTQDSSWDVTEYINVKPSTVYTASNCVGVTASICFYDTNKEYISGIPYSLPKPGGYGTLTFTTPNNCAYARTCVLTVNQSGAGYEFERNVDVFMITEGPTAPETYIPYLQPTDPPVPFPTIQTYQGENTLSSTETVGEVSVKGRISEITS